MVPTEHARLYLPDKPLRRYTALAVERDTRGQNLTDPQRYNYYPASPFATLSWIWTGQIQQVEDWDAGTEPRLGEVMPQLVFSGPFTRPSASWSPGPVHALMVGLYPEFVAGVLGVSPEDYCNRIVPLVQVTPALPAWFVAVCQAVLQAPEAPFACWQQQLGQHLHTGQLAPPPAHPQRLATKPCPANGHEPVGRQPASVAAYRAPPHRAKLSPASVVPAYRAGIWSAYPVGRAFGQPLG